MNADLTQREREVTAASALLGRLPDVPLPPGLLEQCHARVRAAAALHARRRRLLGWAHGAAAAVVALAAGGAFQSFAPVAAPDDRSAWAAWNFALQAAAEDLAATPAAAELHDEDALQDMLDGLDAALRSGA